MCEPFRLCISAPWDDGESCKILMACVLAGYSVVLARDHLSTSHRPQLASDNLAATEEPGDQDASGSMGELEKAVEVCLITFEAG